MAPRYGGNKEGILSVPYMPRMREISYSHEEQHFIDRLLIGVQYVFMEDVTLRRTATVGDVTTDVRVNHGSSRTEQAIISNP